MLDATFITLFTSGVCYHDTKTRKSQERPGHDSYDILYDLQNHFDTILNHDMTFIVDLAQKKYLPNDALRQDYGLAEEDILSFAHPCRMIYIIHEIKNYTC